jgi:hypothetical protein
MMPTSITPPSQEAPKPQRTQPEYPEVNDAEIGRLGIANRIFSVLSIGEELRHMVFGENVPDFFKNFIIGLTPKANDTDLVIATAEGVDPTAAAPGLILIPRYTYHIRLHQPGPSFSHPTLYIPSPHPECQDILDNANDPQVVDLETDPSGASDLFKYAIASRTLRTEIRSAFMDQVCLDIPFIRPQAPTGLDNEVNPSIDLSTLDIDFCGRPMRYGLPRVAFCFDDVIYDDPAEYVPLYPEAPMTRQSHKRLHVHPGVAERMRQDIRNALSLLPDLRKLEIITESRDYFRWLIDAGIWSTLFEILQQRPDITNISFSGGRNGLVVREMSERLPNATVVGVAWDINPCVHYGRISQAGQRPVVDTRPLMNPRAVIKTDPNWVTDDYGWANPDDFTLSPGADPASDDEAEETRGMDEDSDEDDKFYLSPPPPRSVSHA